MSQMRFIFLGCSSINAVKHGGYRYLLGGLLPTCTSCILKDVCPMFDPQARRCGMFEPIQAERMAGILALPHIRAEDVPLVTSYVRNTVFLEIIDFFISRVGPFTKAPDLEVQPVLKTRWTVDNTASRQGEALGLSPASRKALGLGKNPPPRDVKQLEERLRRRKDSAGSR